MHMPSQPLVSIVYAVHNEAEYLSECVESILAQTYRIGITPLSTMQYDGSLEIANRYAARDARIRVVKTSSCCVRFQSQCHLTADFSEAATAKVVLATT